MNGHDGAVYWSSFLSRRKFYYVSGKGEPKDNLVAGVQEGEHSEVLL